MKSTIFTAAALLAVTHTLATPIIGAVNGVISGPAPAVSARAMTIEDSAECDADNVLRDLRNPTASAGASAFCSAYLQRTTTVTSTSAVTHSSTATTTATVVVSSSTTSTQTVATSTILCAAAPTANLTTCNYPAYGFLSYLIFQNPNTDPVTCHELCLADSHCRSLQIQTGGQQYCNLYNRTTRGYVQSAPGDVYTFFDRDCTQYLPAVCAAPTEPKAKRAASYTPTYLTTVPASQISSACSCFITSAGPATTSTAVVQSTSVTISTTTAHVTSTAIVTATASATATVVVTAAP